jgi:predicted DNA-binding protein (MmcQ/YjbR family)
VTVADRIVERLRAIVRALPETGEKTPWGPDPHWTVRDKIFAGYGGGKLGVKVDKELQAALVASDPRFTVAPYVGKHGWVDLALGKAPNWAEVEALILGSYRLIAPRKLVAQLDAAPAPVSARSPTTKRTAKRAPVTRSDRPARALRRPRARR